MMCTLGEQKQHSHDIISVDLMTPRALRAELMTFFEDPAIAILPNNPTSIDVYPADESSGLESTSGQCTGSRRSLLRHIFSPGCAYLRSRIS